MELIDLHVHSDASDGTLAPAAVTALALETGLSAYALTDHDTTDGVREAVDAAKHTPLEVTPAQSSRLSMRDVRSISWACM